jgi:hypothetical protein
VPGLRGETGGDLSMTKMRYETRATGPWSSARHDLTGERGTVEIESVWTAAERGYQLPEGFEVGKA